MHTELPPGALPGEKSDDIEAKLSDGEFVIPAEVVRYYGVKTFESMIKDASTNLGNMQDQGRIKGDEQPMEMMKDKPEGMPTFAKGGLAQTGGVRRIQLPDGRTVFKYVDAQGNPVGDMGSNIIGGPTDRSWKAPGEGEEPTKKKEEPKVETNKPDPYESGHGDGPGGPTDGGVGDGGPTGKGFDSFSDFADAATSQLGSVKDQFSRDLDQALSNFGRDIGVDDTDASVDTSSSATGPDHGETDDPGSAGGPTGNESDTEGSPAGDGGGTAGGADAGSEGSGMGADGSGAENYANGGLVLKKKNAGKRAPGL